MNSIGTELAQATGEMNKGFKKQLRISQNNSAYVDAVRSSCGENPDMANLIYEHTNAFYIKKDESPHKGSQKNESIYICELYIDDPIVRSEINMRREMLRLNLLIEGVDVDDIRIMASKMGMRERHPFRKYVGNSRNDQNKATTEKEQTSVRNNIEIDKSRELETVKRAMCLVFKENAVDVLQNINAADVTLLQQKNEEARIEADQLYRLKIYSADELTRKILKANGQTIVSRCNELGLKISDIQIYKATKDIAKKVAFPPSGMPVPFTLNP